MTNTPVRTTTEGGLDSGARKYMTQAKAISLYTRPDCHLCELAEQLLDNCGVAWESVDIEANLSLIRKYGNYIPVVYRADIDRDLFWPFDAVTLQDFTELEI